MKIDKVTYQTAFVTGPFLQDKVGFEATLEKGDTPEQALSALKEIAAKWQKENVPPVVEQAKVPEIQVGQYVSDVQAVQDILKSKDLKELQTFAKVVGLNPQYAGAYNQRLKELGGKPGKKIVLP